MDGILDGQEFIGRADIDRRILKKGAGNLILRKNGQTKVQVVAWGG